jgi:frataxin-like iron-binding protein CyaY
MRTTKKIRLLTYNCNIFITITDDLNKQVNSLYKKFSHKDTFNCDAEGVVITFDIDNYYIILDKQYLSHNTIAHETYHAVVKVTEEREIVDEESQAWLMGYLSEEVYKFIAKKGFKIVP